MKHIGIIGGGGISETHSKAASEIDGVELVAFFGRNKQKVDRLAATFGGRAYHDFDSFLNHKPMDLVIIGSPSSLHGEQGIAAARSGLHVLTEKPIDTTTKAADELIKECERAGVKLGVCYQDRFAPDLFHLKNLIESGDLGKPILGSGYIKWYRPPSYYAESDWRGTSTFDGGGTLINQGIHTIDLLLWLMGDVTSVYARAATFLHNIPVEDTLVATLEFANGALGTIESTTSVYPGYDRRVEITGEQGTVLVERSRIARADLKTISSDELVSAAGDTNASSSSPIISDVSGHRLLIEDFLEAIDLDRPPFCDGREGRRSLALVEAIYESARTNRPINLS
jgi:predicted dehydrogenase